jgi:hypothetical protein
MNANENTTASAINAPTAARAFALALSKPSDLFTVYQTIEQYDVDTFQRLT